ncbi:MAG TPA: polysaccharide deacetylase family protein [Hanamia sp.]
MLLIYLPHFSERCDYVFKLIFNQQLGIEYAVTNDINNIQNYSEEKINYSSAKISNELFIKSAPLFFEKEIKKQGIIIGQKDQTLVLFPNEEDDVGFDLFSSVFYLVSRYEEYLPFEPDKFGRFKATNSLAFQNNFLQIPIVDIWINIFKDQLEKKFPSLAIKSTTFNAIFTFDIDVAYRFKGRSFGRNLGSLTKDIFKLKTNNIKKRFRVFSKKEKDPWDVYEALEKKIIKNNFPSIFFFLLADKSNYDRNLDPQNPIMKSLINKVKSFSDIGIHPSFYSSDEPGKILIEKERLVNLSGKQITKSRQHFLRFIFPSTYNELLNAGIFEDYSMAYPETPGFRAGTSKPFYFYDIKNEKATSLKVFPVTCMDATFIHYLQKSPEKSLVEILNLLKEIKKVNGTFIPIFHNDNLGEKGEAKKWKSVHDSLVIQVRSYLKKA